MKGKRFIAALLLCLTMTPTIAGASTRQPTILLDMAHLDTANDCGAAYGIWNERDIVNPITDKVAHILVEKGYSVTLTRDYDTPISINDRIALANRTDYDYYISIHANSCATPNTGTGVEAYYNGKASQIMADAMLNKLSEYTELPVRGNYETPYYTAYIPNSILLEIGFVNNSHDLSIMNNNADAIAQIIADSIIQSMSQS